MGRVKTEFTSDPTQVVKALERMQRETVKLREDNARLRKEMRSGAQQTKETFGDGVKSAAKFAAGLASVHQAVAMIRAEYDNLIDRQGKAAGVQVSLAPLQMQAIANLGDDPEITNGQELAKLVDQVVKESNALPRVAWQAMSDALSARGNKTAKDAAEAVTAALRFAPFDEAAALTISGSALDISKIAGTSSEESIGAIAGIAQKARVKDARAQAENVAPAVLSVMGFGDDLASAGALVASMTQAMNDTRGAIGGTASISLGQQLEKFFGRVVPRDDLTTTEERIGVLQADPELRKLFMEGGSLQRNGQTYTTTAASFEKQAFIPIRTLLEGDANNPIVQTYRQADRDLGQLDLQQSYRTIIERNESMPAVRTALAKRAFESATESVQAGNTEGTSAVVRDGLNELRKSLGKGWLDSQIDSIVEPIQTQGRPGLETAVQQLKRMQAHGPGGTGALNVASMFFEDATLGAMKQIGPALGLESEAVAQGRIDKALAARRLSDDQSEKVQRVIDSLERLIAVGEANLAAQAEQAREQRRGAQNKGAAGALAIANAGAK